MFSQEVLDTLPSFATHQRFIGIFVVLHNIAQRPIAGCIFYHDFESVSVEREVLVYVSQACHRDIVVRDRNFIGLKAWGKSALGDVDVIWLNCPVLGPILKVVECCTCRQESAAMIRCDIYSSNSGHRTQKKLRW
jgi:hypothetical protein